MTGLKKPVHIDYEALEAIDFIVMVLKEHEKDLDRLINELGLVTERLEDVEARRAKVNEALSGVEDLEEVKNG